MNTATAGSTLRSCAQLAAMLRRGAAGRRPQVQLVLDHGQVVTPSSAGQRATMQTLLDWGAELRSRSPDGGWCAVYHAKTWIADDAFLI